MAWYDTPTWGTGEDFGLGGLGQMAGGLANLWGGMQGANTANQVSGQVSGALGQNSNAYAQQIQALQDQIKTNQQQAQQAYAAAQANAATQNTGLEGNIGTMQSNLQALSDPNSPYMQQARQAIERKDAAAGRRSQWGERETQLAGTLADFVGKYSPSIQNSITAARNQINQNNQGLASMYSTMNAPGDRNVQALAQMLQGQLAGANSANTVGRQAANSATNNTLGMVRGGLGALGGLANMFSSGSGNASEGGMLGSLWGSSGGSGFGDGALWGNSFTPMSDYGADTSGLGGYGYGNLPMGDYFGGGGFGGVPTAWDGGFGTSLSDDSIWDF